jgi:hypothetical protein
MVSVKGGFITLKCAGDDLPIGFDLLLQV